MFQKDVANQKSQFASPTKNIKHFDGKKSYNMDINDLAFQNSQPRPNKVLSSAQMKHDLLGTKNNPSVCQSERDLNGRLTNYDTLKAPYHSNVANQESKLEN